VFVAENYQVGSRIIGGIVEYIKAMVVTDF
jgi:hypothetical protein